MSSTTYICIKQFNARLGDELSLKIGDKVEVLADDSEYNDGWYMGKNLLTNEVGLYPKSFTQVLLQQQNSEPSLLRSRSRKVLSNNNSSNSSPVTGTPNNVSKLADKFGKMGVEDESSPASKANKTLNDIDKALQELQTENFLGSNGTSTKNNSLDEDLNNNDANDHSKSLTENLNGSKSKSSHQRNPSSQSLTEDLNPLKAAEWTPQQVSSYFAIVLGFDLDIAGKFARHKITGEILFQLDLAHLKELDIDSFGTRFEVHKEIDKLRQIASRSAKHKSISRSTSKNNVTLGSNGNDNSFKDSIAETSTTEDEFVSPPGSNTTSPHKLAFPNGTGKSVENDKRSSKHQSQLMPSADLKPSFYKSHQRKRSQSMDNLHENRHSMIGNDLFVSPRKAPQPPNEPSPVDKNFKFGGASPVEPSGLYVTRTNATGLGLINGTSRPSSSIYESSMISHNRNASNSSQHYHHHRRNSSVITGHRRHSSLFLFLSNNEEKPLNPKINNNKLQPNKMVKDNLDLEAAIDTDNEDDTVAAPKLISPAKVKRENSLFSPKQRKGNDVEDPIDIDNTSFSPKKLKSISYKVDDLKKLDVDEKRSTSDSTGVTQGAGPVSRLKNLRTTSTQNFKNLTTSKKLKTSAFQEGIREVTPDEAIKSANYSGWMSKRSGNTLSWRSRYFTLHGTRLSYFTSLKDKKEKGLIDITAHKVIPIHAENENNTGSNDKYIALYASSTGFGRYCFKLVPPAPGFKKGLTFTQPKTHYFAVDTHEEMRGWLKALMTATIDIDDSVPVVSSCSTPTVSLAKAQELLAKAREETRIKDEELRAKGYIRDGLDDYGSYLSEINTDNQTSLDSTNSPNIDSVDQTTVSSIPPNGNGQPKLSIDTSASFSKSSTTKTPSTPQVGSTQGGFASPYLLASGLLSPRLGHSGNTSSPSGTPNSALKTVDYFQDNQTGNTTVASTNTATSNSESTPKSVYSNGKVISGRKRSISEKMLAYTSDGSGNHTFVIKPKK